ncbi:MAG: hypothetical protein RLZZ210_1508 [Pseudomonadota bacterium]|jgi:CPA2 family monovalent cation:H+ antiporter-2
MPNSLVLLILLSGAVFGILVLKILRLPSILGYLLAGIILGPHAFNSFSLENTHVFHTIGEFGIVFLMFSIGLEFSLPQLKSMPKKIIISAIAQIIVSILLALPTVWAIAYFYRGEFNISWHLYIVVAAIFAMSSTAVVSKVLIEKLQMQSEHGKLIMYILLFQDLVIIPFLVLIPSLQYTNDSIWYMSALILVKIILLLWLVLKAGQPILKKWMDIVAQKQSTELFTLNILLIAIAMATFTQMLDLSMSLGAFLAGLIISETHYKTHVEEDIKPFKEVLLGLFFITVGTSLNLAYLIATWELVLFILFMLVVVKALVIFVTLNLLHKNLSLSIKSALGLAHAGEFGFLLLQQSNAEWFGSQSVQQGLTVAIVISMIITPFLIQYANVIALRFSQQEWINQSLNITQLATKNMALNKHTIITGFSHLGQQIASILAKSRKQYIAIDYNPEIVNKYQDNFRLMYGDATRKEILAHASLSKAKTILLMHNDIDSYIRIASICKKLEVQAQIYMRVDTIEKQNQLLELGFIIDNIICDNIESSNRLKQILNI